VVSRLAFHIAAYKYAVPPSVLGRLCIDDADVTVAPKYVGDDASLERITQYGRENATIVEVRGLLINDSYGLLNRIAEAFNSVAWAFDTGNHSF
jgi:hypothetical protein